MSQVAVLQLRAEMDRRAVSGGVLEKGSEAERTVPVFQTLFGGCCRTLSFASCFCAKGKKSLRGTALRQIESRRTTAGRQNTTLPAPNLAALRLFF